MDFKKEREQLDERVSSGKLNRANRKVLDSVLKQVEGGAVPEAAYVTTRDSLLAIPVNARGEGHGSELRASLEKAGDKKTLSAMQKVERLVAEIATVAKEHGKAYRVVINKATVKADAE